MERHSFRIENAQTAVRLRNFLLGCAVPASLWALGNVVNGLFVSQDLLPAFNTTIETSTRVYLLVTKVVLPLSLASFALEASERAHIRYRRLDMKTPPRGLGERMYDFLAGPNV